MRRVLIDNFLLKPAERFTQRRMMRKVGNWQVKISKERIEVVTT